MKIFAIIFLMATFYKKNTLTKTITFMSLMAGVNIVLSILGFFIPFLSVILVIFLPLTSALVEVNCDTKYFPIYAFGTIGISIAATFYNIDFTIFYIVPSIITGFLFGLMSKKKVAPIWSIFTASLAQTLISLLFLPLLSFLFDKNFVDVLLQIFNTSFAKVEDYLLLAFFLLALVQTILSFIVCRNELTKLGYEQNKISDFSAIVNYSGIGAIILSIGTFFIYKGIGYLFTTIGLFLAFFIMQKQTENREYRKLVIDAIIVFLNIFVFALFNPLMTTGQLLLIGFSPLLISIISLLKIK